VLTVSKPGYMGRKTIKNLEPLMLTNIRAVAKDRGITQLLFGSDGFMVQCLGKFTIPNFNKPKSDFIQSMCASVPAEMKDLRAICEKHATEIADEV